MSTQNVRYIVIGEDHVFDDGIVDWEYLTTYGDWIGSCRVHEIIISNAPDGSPRFTFGRDVTDEAIDAHFAKQEELA